MAAKFARSIFTVRSSSASLLSSDRLFASAASKRPPLPWFSRSTISPEESLRFIIPGATILLSSRSTSMTYSSFRDADSDNTFQSIGVDFKHWQVLFRKPNVDGATNEDYVKTLGKVLGSEEEAKKKIYSASFDGYFGFGAEVDEETAEKLKDADGVLSVLPDVSVAKKAKDDPVWTEFLQMIYKTYVKILEGKQ